MAGHLQVGAHVHGSTAHVAQRRGHLGWKKPRDDPGAGKTWCLNQENVDLYNKNNELNQQKWRENQA